eukprot:COSAG03_NODE_46_length_16816_cov_6.510492_4_plen_60_part_00
MRHTHGHIIERRGVLGLKVLRLFRHLGLPPGLSLAPLGCPQPPARRLDAYCTLQYPGTE